MRAFCVCIWLSVTHTNKIKSKQSKVKTLPNFPRLAHRNLPYLFLCDGAVAF